MKGGGIFDGIGSPAPIKSLESTLLSFKIHYNNKGFDSKEF